MSEWRYWRFDDSEIGGMLGGDGNVYSDADPGL